VKESFVFAGKIIIPEFLGSVKVFVLYCKEATFDKRERISRNPPAQEDWTASAARLLAQ
jgi:hypothetical protein